MIIIKRAFAMFLLPLGMVAAILLVGVVIGWRWPHSRVGPLLVLAATAGLLFGSCSPGANLMLRPLEERYPPLLEVDAGAMREVDYVMVLGAGFVDDDRYPLVAQIHEEGVMRLVEGIRILRKLPHARLVVSGGTRKDGRTNAEATRQLAIDLGVAPERIVMADRALDTAQEARAFEAMAGPGASLVLVTSASHMPRAMQLFERRGLKPTPAPCAHRVIEGQGGGLWPNATHLRKTERAFYEWAGRLFVTLGGS
ncbi:hypothetical protein FRC98_12470 [Lujinxingia vulgaris]|uniref:DUF218 domain-containing protein n=1 Tax=Lujinxingia vulgaris TaxID=2600176 RepID=A0A5C6XEV6_9DELT|nr:ElyC/SanA/YdcF family protein [Lujinxingia vulgaris]TXD36644.1 hypothetical protein FRC98_12470 [Lujinxingia vulgaris]